MKIAIIELEDHAECIYSLVKIMSLHNDEVYFFLNKGVYHELCYMSEFNATHFKIVLLDSQTSIADFLAAHLQKLNECAIIFFTTVQQNFQSYPITKLKGKKILRIHNANTFSDNNRSKNIDLEPYILWKDFSFFLREIILNSFWKNYRMFKRDIDFFVFPDDCIVTYARKNKLFPADKILGAIPLACMNGQRPSPRKTKNSFKIVITGVIDQRRKDYKIVLDAMKQVLRNMVNTRALELVLLGKPKGPYGKSIIASFQELESEFFTIRTFDKRIDQEEFEQEMITTDILLAPIRVNTRYKYFKETYGWTKQSGSISDLIRYQKPLIIPVELETEKNLRPYIHSYSSKEELVQLISDFLTKDNIKPLNFKRLEEKYSNAAIYKRTIELIQSHLK